MSGSLMEWDEKFLTILKETERNIANAKGKLTSKVTSPFKKSDTASVTIKNKLTGSSRVKNKTLPEIKEESETRGPSLIDMNNSTTSMEMLHMQEQIASQNRMIEKLQRLVKTLDIEREFYKEQLSDLKGDIDVLTNTVKNQSSMLNSELKASSVKNEVMHEINKVKAMVYNFERDSNKRSGLLSPRFDPEFWDIKENLTGNLEDVRFELNQMKKRIDHMEDRIALAHNSSTKTERLPKGLTDTDHLLSKPLYTPTNGATCLPYNSDLQLLRLNISSLTEKLDNLERKNRLHPTVYQTQSFPLKDYFQPRDHKDLIDSGSPKYSSRISSAHFIDNTSYDVESISDLSELSNLSDNGNIDDLDFDLLTLNSRDDDVELPFSSELNPAYSKKSKRKGKVEFELNDLDLSDLDDEEDINLESDNLDFDN